MIPIAFDTNDSATAASNTAVVITYNADGVGRSHVITGVECDYGAAPTAGSLKIEDGSGRTVFNPTITAAGPAPFYFEPYRQGSPNTALIITLAAGGAGVVGKINVLGHYTTASTPANAESQYGPNNGVLDFSFGANSGLLAAIF